MDIEEENSKIESFLSSPDLALDNIMISISLFIYIYIYIYMKK